MISVTFLRAFDFKTSPQSLLAYPAGWSGKVDEACAAEAIAAGAAEAVPPAAKTTRSSSEPEASVSADKNDQSQA